MNRFLKNTLIRVSALGKIFPTRLTPEEDVKALIYSLRPRLADQELIRLGPSGDGGYLVPDDLEDIEACLSPGVALVSGFERDCAALGMKIFMADKSVDGPAELHDSFQFTKKFIGATSSDDVMTIDSWISDALPGTQSDLLLQIDIEGAEYETFLSTSDMSMNRFRIIVAEFHDLDKILSEPFFRIASSTFNKILQTHVCVHIHPNNCFGSVKAYDLEIPIYGEFTFLRKDRIRGEGFATVFPHPLDCDNTANPALTLPRSWV